MSIHFYLKSDIKTEMSSKKKGNMGNAGASFSIKKSHDSVKGAETETSSNVPRTESNYMSKPNTTVAGMAIKSSSNPQNNQSDHF